jgi:hypothetical protein
MKDVLVGMRDLSDGSDQHGDANAPDRDEVAARNGGGELRLFHPGY